MTWGREKPSRDERGSTLFGLPQMAAMVRQVGGGGKKRRAERAATHPGILGVGDGYRTPKGR
jgi:hypothetical protein